MNRARGPTGDRHRRRRAAAQADAEAPSRESQSLVYLRLPPRGCLLGLLAATLLCLVPLVLVETLHTALTRLHLSGPVAALAVVGILAGSLVNLPVWRRPADTDRVVEWTRVSSEGSAGDQWAPKIRSARGEPALLVNLGGCLIPLVIALWEARLVVVAGGQPLVALAIAVGLNVLASNRLAQPLGSLGVRLPLWVSPVVSLAVTWALLGGEAGAEYRPAVAFTAGVLGPLVGADLWHVWRTRGGWPRGLVVGGAGTFDGIALSGILAALLA